MCLQSIGDHVVQIPEADLRARYELPGVPLKRAEYHTQLAGIRWHRDNLSFSVLANQTIGVGWRIPWGEIWVPIYLQAKFVISTAQAWTEIQPKVWWGVPICLNGLFTPADKVTVDKLWGASVTAGSFANFNKVWSRDDNALFYTKFAENQLLSVSAKVGGPATWQEAMVTIIYWRTRLYDKLLLDLREREGNDCEVQKLLMAAFPWVNLRNDKDY